MGDRTEEIREQNVCVTCDEVEIPADALGCPACVGGVIDPDIAHLLAEVDRLTAHAGEGWALANRRTRQWKEAEARVRELEAEAAKLFTINADLHGQADRAADRLAAENATLRKAAEKAAAGHDGSVCLPLQHALSVIGTEPLTAVYLAAKELADAASQGIPLHSYVQAYRQARNKVEDETTEDDK
jgi:hypothetical protein